MPTTLLVEGDDALAALLHELLDTELGYRVVRARDCAQAWQLFQMQNPDALLLDLAYPYEDGLDLCDRVLAAASFAPRTVVVLTSRSDETLTAQPAVTVLSKPFDVADLLYALRAAGVAPISSSAPYIAPPL